MEFDEVLSKIIGRKHKYIPHQCAVCSKEDLYWDKNGERNYVYHKGNYYHEECYFKNRKKRGVR